MPVCEDQDGEPLDRVFLPIGTMVAEPLRSRLVLVIHTDEPRAALPSELSPSTPLTRRPLGRHPLGHGLSTQNMPGYREVSDEKLQERPVCGDS